MSHGTPITMEEFKAVLPLQVRKIVSQDVVDNINNAIQDPEVLAVYRENVLGLTTVMSEGKFKINDYLNAVRFVSHKLLGDTHTAAWTKTFPSRHRDMVQRGNSPSEIASVCSRYASSKLVILLLGQTMMPTHILNAPLYQEALNSQAELMRYAKSEKVRQDAGAKLLDILKPPETKKIELDIGVKEDSSVAALRETTMKLVRMQEEMIEKGQVSVTAVASSKLIGSGETQEGAIIDV